MSKLAKKGETVLIQVSIVEFLANIVFKKWNQFTARQKEAEISSEDLERNSF